MSHYGNKRVSGRVWIPNCGTCAHAAINRRVSSNVESRKLSTLSHPSRNVFAFNYYVSSGHNLGTCEPPIRNLMRRAKSMSMCSIGDDSLPENRTESTRGPAFSETTANPQSRSSAILPRIPTSDRPRQVLSSAAHSNGSSPQALTHDKSPPAIMAMWRLQLECTTRLRVAYLIRPCGTSR